MTISKKILDSLPMYFNGQLSPVENLLINLKNNKELTEENKIYLNDFPVLKDGVNLFINTLFYNDFYTIKPSKAMGILYKNSIVIDPKTEYVTNSNGFRGKEFSDSDKVIALGCSHTHGMGLRNDLIWINQLAKMMGVDEMSNLGVSGASLIFIIENAFKYFAKFGNPEYIVLFAPDLYRFKVTQNKKFNINKNNSPNQVNIPFIDNEWVSPMSYSQRESIVKVPHNTSELMPIEYIFWLNMQFLKMLIIYCRSNNIKLVWTSWHMPFSDLAKQLKEEGNSLFDEFFYFDFRKFDNIRAEDLDCHKDVMDSGKEYFNHALDLEVSGSPHWGSHLHMHIAEEFFEQIKKVGYES